MKRTNLRRVAPYIIAAAAGVLSNQIYVHYQNDRLAAAVVAGEKGYDVARRETWSKEGLEKAVISAFASEDNPVCARVWDAHLHLSVLRWGELDNDLRRCTGPRSWKD